MIRFFSFFLSICLFVYAESADASSADLLFKRLNQRSVELQSLVKNLQGVISPEDRKTLLLSGKEGIDDAQSLNEMLIDDANKALARIHGSMKPKVDLTDSTFPFLADDSTPALLRAHTLAGDLSPLNEVLFPLALDFIVLARWLEFEHLTALGKGKAYLPPEEYQLIRLELENLTNAVRRIFPSLPGLPWWSPAVLSEALTQLTKEGKPTAEEQQALNGAFEMINNGFRMVSGYEANYPEQDFSRRVGQFLRFFSQFPGATDCSNLAEGLSTFEGEACRPKQYREELGRFIDFHKSRIQPHVMAMILDYVITLSNQMESGPLTEMQWKSFQSQLTQELVRSSAANDPVKKTALTQVVANLFGEMRKDPKFLEDGLRISRYLRRELHDAGFNTFGILSANMTPIVDTMKLTLNKLDHQIRALHDPTSGVPRNEAEAEAMRNVRYPEVYERLNSDPAACSLFTDKNADKAPWVVAAQKFAPDVEKGTPYAFNFASSTFGNLQIQWAHEIKIGNAVTIQDKSDIRDKVFAAAATRKFMSWNIPTIVQTMMIMGQDVRGDTLSAIGLKMGRMAHTLALIQYPMERYSYPSLDVEVKAARAASEAFLEDYAKQTKQELTPELWKTYRDSVYKKRLLEAANNLKRLKESKRNLEKNFAKIANPSLQQILQWTPDQAEHFGFALKPEAINRTLIGEVYPTFVEEYVYFYAYKNKSLEEKKALTKKLMSTFTVDQFRDMLQWYIHPGHQFGDPPREVPPGAKLHMVARLPGVPSKGSPKVTFDFIKELVEHPILAGRFLVHAQNSSPAAIELMETSAKEILYQFPMLRDFKVNPATPLAGGKWERYVDADFETVMQAFLDNAVKTGNRVLDLEYIPLQKAPPARQRLKELADTTLWATDLFWNRVTDPITFFLPMRALQDEVLRVHPDLKLALCDEQKYRADADWWIQTGLLAADAAGVLAAAGGPLVAGTAVTAGLYLSVGQTYQKGQELARARAVALAGASQMNSAITRENAFYLQELNNEYSAQLAQFALEAVVLGGAYGVSVAKFSKSPLSYALRSAVVRAGRAVGSQFERGVLIGIVRAGKAQRASVWFKKLPAGKLKEMVAASHRYGESALGVMEEIGYLERFTRKELIKTLSLRNVRIRELPMWAAHNVMQAVHMEASVHLAGPFLLVGRRLGTKGLGAGFALYGGVVLTEHLIDKTTEVYTASFREELGQNSWTHLHNNADIYRAYLDAQYDGEFDNTVTLQIVEIDKNLKDNYRGQLREWAKNFKGTVSRAARENTKQEVQYLIEQRQKAIDEELAKATVDINRVRVYREHKRLAEQTLAEMD